MRTKPFCLAVGKDWTSRPSKTDLREIHTNLTWKQKFRKECQVDSKYLESLVDLLDDEELQQQGPVRILVLGMYRFENEGYPF